MLKFHRRTSFVHFHPWCGVDVWCGGGARRAGATSHGLRVPLREARRVRTRACQSPTPTDGRTQTSCPCMLQLVAAGMAWAGPASSHFTAVPYCTALHCCSTATGCFIRVVWLYLLARSQCTKWTCYFCLNGGCSRNYYPRARSTFVVHLLILARVDHD